MATLLEDLTDIEEKAQGLVENKVANFAYTQEAYDNDDVDGVSEYNVNNAQNIPTAEAETLDVNPTVLNKGYRSQASSITRMLMNHFLGRTSYNLNKSIDLFKKGFLGIKNALGNPNGIATLNENGYLGKEQIFPVLTKEKLKKFLFSGKEPSLKDLGFSGSSSTLRLISARSINEKEDVIIFALNNTLYIYKYDGETFDEIISNAYPSLAFICEYKNYALFYSINAIPSGTTAYLMKFNFDTLELEEKQITLSSSREIWFCTFNKNKECFNMIKSTLQLGTTANEYTSTNLISVDLTTFIQSETTLYIPNMTNNAVPYTNNDVRLSGNLIILCQTNSPGYKLLIFKIDDLTNTSNNKKSLIFGHNNPYVFKVEGTKIVFSVATATSTDKMVIIDNTNFYTLDVASDTGSTLARILSGYSFIQINATDGTALTRIYKNNTFCTELPYSSSNFSSVYDSIFYTELTLIDVENSENVITVTTKLEKVIKSDRRAYTIRNISESYIPNNKLFEITNVLD